MLGLVRTVILARLLLPGDIGLVHLALSVIGGLHAFATTGLQPALIHRRDVDAAVLNTAWVISTLRGVLLCAILVGVAPFLADFFNQPLVGPIIRFLALNQILDGLRNIGFVLFQKELDFKRRATFYLLAGFLTTVVSAGAALLLRNVWALVIGEMFGGLIRLYLSYRIHPYRPKLKWDSKIALELFNFGKHILAFRIIDYFLLSGDDLLVGRFLGPEALGFYAYAYVIANLPATVISTSVTGVILPVYAKLHDETTALPATFLRTFRFVGFLSFPSGLLMLALAPQLTRILLGETWLPMVPGLRVLCIFGVLRSFGFMYGALFQGIGSPDRLKNIAFWQLVSTAVVIYPCLTRFGLVGVATAVTFGIFIFDLLLSLQLKRLIGVTPLRLLSSVSRPLIAAITVSVLVNILTQNVILDSPLPFLAVLLVCCVTYLIAIAILDRGLTQEILEMLRHTFGEEDDHSTRSIRK